MSQSQNEQKMLSILVDNAWPGCPLLTMLLEHQNADFEVLYRPSEEHATFTIQDSRFIRMDAPLSSMAEKARGNYLLLSDPDSIPDSSLLTEVPAQALSAQADLVLFEVRTVSGSSGHVQENSAERSRREKNVRDNTILDKAEHASHLFCLSDTLRDCKLYRKELFLQPDVLACFHRPLVFHAAVIHYAKRILRLNTSRYTRQTNQNKRITCPEPSNLINDLFTIQGKLDISELPSWGNLFVQESFKALRQLENTRDARHTLIQSLREANQKTGFLSLAQGAPWAETEYQQLHALISTEQTSCTRLWRTSLPSDIRLCHPRSTPGTPKVSVLMPIYNSAAYLPESLNSILNQRFIDFELVCIDDGSTDNTLEVLLSYAQKDPRISVYTQSNRGVSTTRNECISYATGTYLCFVDSDDLLDEKALELLTERADRDQLDQLIYQMDVFTENELNHNEQVQTYLRNFQSKAAKLTHIGTDVICTGLQLLSELIQKSAFLVNPILRFTRRKWLLETGIQFIPGIIHEDNPHSFACLLKASRVVLIQDILYHRRFRPDSIMTTSKTLYNCYSCTIGIHYMKRLIHHTMMEDACRTCLLAYTDGLQKRMIHLYNSLPLEETIAAWEIPDPVDLSCFQHLTVIPSQADQIKQIQQDAKREKKELIDAHSKEKQQWRDKLTQDKQQWQDKLAHEKEKRTAENLQWREKLSIQQAQFIDEKTRLNAENARLQNEIIRLQNELDLIHASRAYRISSKISSLVGPKK